ncbi:MAG TPA: type 2 isopentenyl-diphosphate Delta-isomerase [Aggregatilineales bacterium]|nr:type 2 isopentenyl-diphosphate Delta-isomerase [Aggregatilineales bacterium]
MSKVTERRKEEHININLTQDVKFPTLKTGLEKYRFLHHALPEIDFKDINTEVSIFGKKTGSPVFISSMTGGTERAQNINRTLAQVAQEYHLAMGVGSQRAALEDPEQIKTFQVRPVAPDILLFANLGAVQLNYHYGINHCLRAVEMIEADALILHFNALQEAVQPEGDTNFYRLSDKVAEVCAKLPVPVIAKEVGWGFSPPDVRLLADAGVSAIDVAGSGGTSWSQVEYHRAPTAFHAEVARSFADWGIETAEAIRYVKDTVPGMTVFASGGLRTGIDAAKCIALGATLTGIAGSFLKAADQSIDAVRELVEILQAQLKISMFCTGSRTIEELARAELIQSD